jgi:short subunit dehydrogenase-like uncharacterized protein
VSSRELDLVLVGATGFTGRLTARHLAEHAPADLRIGLAGRSRDRLEAVRAGLEGAARDWPLLVVDTLDEEAVADLAARTGVVATTAGPYVKYGGPLVRACAAAGTHYCDLTGEVLFVHESIADNHEAARRTGARIVHACGFDSVPSDLAVLLAAEAAHADGADLGRTRLAARMSGMFSGGTIDTARTQAAQMRSDPVARRIVMDPWALVEGGRPARPAGGGSGAARTPRGGVGGLLDRVVKASPVRQDPDTGHFTGMFVMASFNTRIVARSASLLGYGDRFRYSEHADYGPGPTGAVRAGVYSTALLAGLAGLAFTPTRAVLDRVLPAPGHGPSEHEMATGRFRLEATAEATDGARYRARVGARLDPGYTGTAVMFGQAALALATGDGLPECEGGVLTPATAIGTTLADRLRDHGFTVEVERLPT